MGDVSFARLVQLGYQTFMDSRSSWAIVSSQPGRQCWWAIIRWTVGPHLGLTEQFMFPGGSCNNCKPIQYTDSTVQDANCLNTACHPDAQRMATQVERVETLGLGSHCNSV